MLAWSAPTPCPPIKAYVKENNTPSAARSQAVTGRRVFTGTPRSLVIGGEPAMPGDALHRECVISVTPGKAWISYHGTPRLDCGGCGPCSYFETTCGPGLGSTDKSVSARSPHRMVNVSVAELSIEAV